MHRAIPLDWPARQLFTPADGIHALSERCRPAFESACRALDLEADLTPLLPSMYLPLCAWLEKFRRHRNVLVVGLNGGQGSGKSTVCELLKVVLREGFGASVASFSIDDIYKTREDRQRMGREVHPLFVTRGVPGTHEVQLGVDTVNALKRLGGNDTVRLPAFDKASDTRVPQSEWPRHSGKADIVILEGWCVGATPQDAAALREPVNELERREDPDGVWRRAVNEALIHEYGVLFGLLDVQLMLRIDSMQRVFQWRRLQEHKLAARVAAAGIDAGNTRIMSDEQVDRFIMHYERLTRHMLAVMPSLADIVFALDDTHNPATVRINKPIG